MARRSAIALTRADGLHVLEAHSLYHRYPPTLRFDTEFDERILRLIVHRVPSTDESP